MQGLYFANHLHCFTCYPPVTSACLLVTSLLPTVLLARTGLPVTLSSASFLHLAVTVQPSAHDTPFLLQPLALLPSHLLPSLTISPISSLPALAALMHTTFSLYVLYSCLSFPCLLLPYHLTAYLLLPYQSLPCPTSESGTCPHLIPFTVSPFTPTPSHSTTSLLYSCPVITFPYSVFSLSPILKTSLFACFPFS